MHDILVYARQPAADTPAVRHALALAASTDAALTAVFAAPLYLGSAVEPTLAALLIDDTRRLVAAALEAKPAFLARAHAAGVARASWLVAEGGADEALAQAAPRHDLLVLDHADGEDAAASDVVHIVLRTGVASLVLPRDAAPSTPPASPRRLAVAWNGSAEAMRAVHAARTWLPGSHVLLLRGVERERYPGLAWHPPFDVADYLQAHGAVVEVQAITATADAVGGVLLQRAGTFGAELLVMGAYGRGRLSEWALGGATRDALRLARLPLLLHH